MRKIKYGAILLDVLLVAVVLVAYALPHHVIPRCMAAQEIQSCEDNLTIEFHIAGEDSENKEVEEEATPTNNHANEPKQEPETLREKFAEHFTEEVVQTANSYSSPNLSIHVTEHISDTGGIAQRWYVADVYVADVQSVQTYMPGGTYNSSGMNIVSLTKEADGLLAVNGDYSAFAAGGVSIKNGVLCRNDWYDADICVLYQDGTMKCYAPSEFDAEAAIENGAWQAWTFGPSLLNSRGEALTEFSSVSANILNANPRTAIGYFEPGHYCLVVADGRQTGIATGFTMQELAKEMETLGCQTAFNLDGGQSAQMVLHGDRINSPCNGGRYVNDIVVIKEVN